jgi:hypothetical protein
MQNGFERPPNQTDPKMPLPLPWKPQAMNRLLKSS